MDINERNITQHEVGFLCANQCEHPYSPKIKIRIFVNGDNRYGTLKIEKHQNNKMKECISFSNDNANKQLSNFIKFLYDNPERNYYLIQFMDINEQNITQHEVEFLCENQYEHQYSPKIKIRIFVNSNNRYGTLKIEKHQNNKMKECISFSNDSDKKQLSNFIEFLYDKPELSSILKNPERPNSKDNSLFLKYDGEYLTLIEEISELFASEDRRENFLNALSQNKDCVKKFIEKINWNDEKYLNAFCDANASEDRRENFLNALSKNKDCVKKFIEKINWNDEKYLNAFCDANPEIKDFMILKERKEGLKEFKNLINDLETKETDFQKFFDKNNWVFNICLEDRLLIVCEKEFRISSSKSKKSNNLDFLAKILNGKNHTNDAVIIEVKKPSTILLNKSSENIKRNNIEYHPSEYLSGALMQLASYRHLFIRHFNGNLSVILDEDNKSNKQDGEIHSLNLIDTRKILLIGSTKDFDKEQLHSFAIIRELYKSITIITYDELYEKAKAIVEFYQSRVDGNEGSNNIKGNSNFSSNNKVIEEQ